MRPGETYSNPNLSNPAATYRAALDQLHALTNAPPGAPLPPMAPDAWVGTAPPPTASPPPTATSWDPSGLFQRLQQFVSHLLHPAPQPAPTPAPTAGSGPMLRPGTHGAPVRALQERLQQLGFNPGPIDGDFGPQTQAAVLAFQRSRGLEADGVVGPETWRHLGITVSGDVTYGPPGSVVTTPISGDPDVVAQRFIDSAKRFLGIPYLYGGGHSGYMAKPGRVDCSGLVLQAAHMAGFNLDGCAADQQRRGQPVSLNALKPGDLVFKGTPAHHVAIYIGNGQVIEAPYTGAVVRIASVKGFDNARRIF